MRGKACLNAVFLILLVAAEGQLRLVLVVVVDEEVLALVLVGHVGAGRGRVGRLQGLRGGQGLGALRHGGGQAARGLVTRILTQKKTKKVRHRVWRLETGGPKSRSRRQGFRGQRLGGSRRKGFRGQRPGALSQGVGGKASEARDWGP
jgi:hypothetical protein